MYVTWLFLRKFFQSVHVQFVQLIEIFMTCALLALVRLTTDFGVCNYFLPAGELNFITRRPKLVITKITQNRGVTDY